MGEADKDDKDDGDDDDDDELVTMTPPGGNITATMEDPDMGNSTMMDSFEDMCTCDKKDNMISCTDPEGESMCMCDMDGEVVCEDSDEPPKKDEDPVMEDPSMDVPAMEAPATEAPVATPVIVTGPPPSNIPVVSGSAKTNV